MSAMDSNVQPSFIPKKTLTQPGQRPKQHVSLFSLIASIIFMTVVLIAIGVFGYKFFLIKSIEHKKEDLQTELNKFQGKQIEDFMRLDNRFTAAQELLNKHFSLSAFFSKLGQTTLKNVRFSTFLFNTEGGNPTVALTGEAVSFTAVALQQREFAKQENSAFYKDGVVTNPNLDKDGNVTFSYTMGLNPAPFSYVNGLKEKGITIEATPVKATSTTALASSTVTTKASTTKATTTKPKAR
jgi:hypothetical protein